MAFTACYDRTYVRLRGGSLRSAAPACQARHRGGPGRRLLAYYPRGGIEREVVALERWSEVGEGVFALRYAFFDQTIGLVVGDDACLVIDTRTTSAQARELQEDVRTITPHPWTVLNTHHHYDHTFGNSAFRPAQIWGHERCAAVLLRSGERMRKRVMRQLPDLAREIESVEIVPPSVQIAGEAQLRIGGRVVELRHLGRGHTDNDVVAFVPDSGVLFAGDLVEEGAPPAFGDSYPLDWPETDRRLLALARGAIVPGHGEVVGAAFVQAQAEELAAAAEAIRTAHLEAMPLEEAAARVPFPEPCARDCIARGFAQLDEEEGTGGQRRTEET